MKTMEQRANKIETMLEQFAEARARSLDECLTDILTDIRHFCDYRDIDFHRALDFSYDHYCAEIREDD